MIVELTPAVAVSKETGVKLPDGFGDTFEEISIKTIVVPFASFSMNSKTVNFNHYHHAT
jgi:hypothetical protein